MSLTKSLLLLLQVSPFEYLFFNFFLQVDKHLRKLDQELTKFKMELEADNAGITEILEQSKSQQLPTCWPLHAYFHCTKCLCYLLTYFLVGSLRLDEPVSCASPIHNNHRTPSSLSYQQSKCIVLAEFFNLLLPFSVID